MQSYPGNGSISAPTLLAGYGIWPTPQVATGGDLRNAANLMAAAQSATDRTNALAQRVLVRLNVIDGSTSTFTSTVKTRNKWQFDGHVEFITGASGDVRSFVPFYIVGASTLHVGHASLGAGTVEVLQGSEIRLDGSNSGSAFKSRLIAQDAKAEVSFVDGATATFDSASFLEAYGTNGLGDSSGAGQTTQRHPFIKSGDYASTQLRSKNLPTSGTINPWEADIWYLPTGLGAPAAVNCADASFTYEFKVAMTSANMGANFALFNSSDTGRMGQFVHAAGVASGYLATVTYRYRPANSEFYVVSFWDGTGALNATALFAV